MKEKRIAREEKEKEVCNSTALYILLLLVPSLL